jgi:hypothetical protein
MDSLIAFYSKNTKLVTVLFLVTPVALVLIYGVYKSISTKRKNKKERAIIYDFLVKSEAIDRGIANEDIAKGTGLPKDRVAGHCSDHPWIEDAGKRQRSWKLVNESERK